MSSPRKLSNLIKQKAKEIGFDECGISKAEFLDQAAKKLKLWLNSGFHADMKYMENHFEKRVDPQQLVEDTKSVISVILNYRPQNIQPKDTYKISKYAYGEDYHFVLKRKLKNLMQFINDNIPGSNGRAFTDSAPVMERDWAGRAGLGWIGKHSLLINKNQGSYVFIGELLVNIELEYDNSIEEYCGTCTRCIDSCPTGAIVQPYVIDSNKCISYQTIENKGEIDENLKGKFKDYIFGCDICQDICPWNNKKIYSNETLFKPDQKFLSLNYSAFENIDQGTFAALFKNTPVKRAGFTKFKSNIAFVKSSGK